MPTERTRRNALAKLTHDHCAKYLAHVAAHACVLLGDREAFAQTWKAHRRYFTGSVQGSEWFDGQYRHLLFDIPRMGELLDQDRMYQFEDAAKAMRHHQPLNAENDVPLSKIPVWLWILLAWLLVGAISNLFNSK